MALTLSGTNGVQDNVGAFVQGTQVNSTSGTAIDFTSIPSWVKRVVVIFSGVSTNGSTNYLIQLGSSGGIESTGYTAGGWTYNATFSSTSGLIANYAISATDLCNGKMIIENISSNNWVSTSIFNSTTINQPSMATGSKSLSGVLDRVRITTVGGNTFDAGTINILYE